MDSEWKQFLDALKVLGIQHTILWQMPKEEWQDRILEAGFNVTSIGCCAVVIGRETFVFSMGQAIWYGDEGHGPSGAFLFRCSDTGHVETRCLNVCDRFLNVYGVRALSEQYRF